MINFKRTISAVMAVLVLALSFVTVYADESEMDVPTRDYAYGTYNGYDYSFSSLGSSLAKIKCRGEYEVQTSMTLKFTFRLCYRDNDGNYVYGSTTKTIVYGAYTGYYLTKSYTVSQAITAANITNAHDDSYFSYCIYKLLFNSTIVSYLRDDYITI